MTRIEFGVHYRGKALEAGEMDVRDLAPALLALGQLCNSANRVLSGQDNQVAVYARAGFPKGSFGAELVLANAPTVLDTLSSLPVLDTFSDWLSGNRATALANLITFVGFGTSLSTGAVLGLIKLVRFAKGKLPKRATRPRPGTMLLSFEHGDVEVPEETGQLFQDGSVREHLYKVVAPLEAEGISELEFTVQGKPGEKIIKSDVPAFRVPEVEDQLLNETPPRKKIFTIVSLAFEEDNKWRLNDGQGTSWVKIADKAFLASVDRGEITFGKGDMMECIVIERQYQTPKGTLRTDYEAIEAIHRPKARQLFLPTEEVPEP